MKPRLIFKVGRKYKALDLTELVGYMFDLKRTETKRLIKQGAVEIIYEDKNYANK